MPQSDNKPVVLIVTHSKDNQSIPLVTQAISEGGGKAFRFNSDYFPTAIDLHVEYVDSREKSVLVADGQELDLEDVTSVWYRRVAIAQPIPRSMDFQLRKASIGESKATVQGMIASLDAFHLYPVYRLRRAENKQLQLKVARSLGIETPRTLITNQPEVVRRFAGECPHGMVMKTLSSFAIFEEDQEQVVFTNQVSADDLKYLEGLKYCPNTFQELLPKTVELRTTVVGDQLFTAAIDSQKSEKSRLDWRRDRLGLIDDWEIYDLPDEVRQKLLKLMQLFQLSYGAVDFIVTPDGRHVFLEINPVGEFFWMELKNQRFPISRAIADRLLVGRNG